MSREYQIEVPPVPLSIELYRMRELEEVDQEQVVHFVTYDGLFDPRLITIAKGRNIWFPQIMPIGAYDTIQVSGAGFFDVGLTDNTKSIAIFDHSKPYKPIQPPRAGSKLFTHTTTVVSDGRARSITQRSPMGSYIQESATSKYRNAHSALQLSAKEGQPFLAFLVPLPLTLVRYPDIPDGQGGKQSGLVYSCPLGGIRAEDMVMPIIRKVLRRPADDKRNSYVSEQVAESFFPILTSMGKAIYTLHTRKLCHYQMTLGNVSPVLNDWAGHPLVCLYDWETLSLMDERDPFLARAYDIGVTLVSWLVTLHTIAHEVNLPKKEVLSIGYSALLSYLQGYCGEDPISVHKKLAFSNEQVVDLCYGSTQDIVSLVKDHVFSKFPTE